MARKIIWSKRAQGDRRKLFSYWNKRNKSNQYSIRLNLLFIEAAEFIAVNPHTGRVTDNSEVRIKFISHYAMIYDYSHVQLRIMAIFDTRQNPDKLDGIIKK